MPSAGWALQQSIFATLTADAPLLGLLGAARIYDDVPRGAGLPYVTFGHSLERDWSTASEDGLEHVVTLHVWTGAGGKKNARAIMQAMREALHDQALSLDGHRLVNLRHEFSEARREPDGDLVRGISRYRAITEPAG
jgi:hypothetical protein